MKVSDAGLLEIAEHEHIVPGPYLDSKGIWTYGIGHTAAAGDPVPAMMPRGMPTDLESEIVKVVKLFKKDVAKYEKRVNDAIKVPLKQHEFDSLVSFDINTGGIYRAFLTREINAGNPEAYKHFMGWVKPPELRKRRSEEMALFRTGDYAANGDKIGIWKVDAQGKLRGIIKHFDGSELLKLLKEDQESDERVKMKLYKPETVQIIHETKPHNKLMDDTLEKALNAKPARWWSRWFK